MFSMANVLRKFEIKIGSHKISLLVRDLKFSRNLKV